MKINLIIGVNVSLGILFKKENIITPTTANMSARVRLFDDSGNLVGTWMSSEGVYALGGYGPVTHGYTRAADGTTQYPFNGFGTHTTVPALGGGTGPFVGGSIPYPLPLNGYNFVPGGTTLLNILMAGIPEVPGGGTNSGPGGGGTNKRGTIAGVFRGEFYGDPVLPAVSGACGSFEIDCYANPGPNWNAPSFWPNSGIMGAPDYQGGWSAEVDLVNLYLNNTGTQEPLFESWGLPCAAGTPQYCGQLASDFIGASFLEYAQYYTPVTGLLMGESYHIIPGTVAKSGISLTEDMALGPSGVRHSMAPNHLGPYSQEGTWAIAGTHNSGEASAIYEVDLNGFVSGTVLAFTWSNEFRPLSWGTVSVTGAGLPSSGLTFYTYDGIYQAYLPSPGPQTTTTYTFKLFAPGYAPYSWTSAVSTGSTGSGQNVYLEQSNIPVPEFSSIAVIAFSALAASLYLLRRRRQ